MRQPVLNDRIISSLIEKDGMRELCALMLYEVYENGAYTNLVIKRCDQIAVQKGIYLKTLRAMLYGTVTYTYAIDFMIRHIAKRDVNELDPFLRVLIRLGAWQILFSDKIPSFAAVSETVNIADKYCPEAKGLVNAVLRRLCDASAEDREPDNYRPDVRVSLKSEIYGIFKRDYGKDRALSIGKAFLNRPVVTIRFDPAKISAAEIENRLAEESFSVNPGSFLPEVMKVETGLTGLEDSETFRSGLFFVQNEAAALASHIASPKRGDKILDCCAAPGGKTTHMAELVSDDADILATDSSESRLELLKQNIERLGINSIRTKVMDCTDMSGLDEVFDIVLADSPCSGLGIIGRKPDIRLNMTYDKIAELKEIQHTILAEASTKVKPGGALIYCTCTINKDENERQVERFLSEHPDFRAVSIMPYLPESIIMDEERLRAAENGCITLLPDVDSCDGFFVARMERLI
ncbi:MAG: 16S rRNA (cytosine(967)-C(5))-methyltransferase RsmB [Clostridiales bacterium]|nr:16S rRNA (cytosine(967)-C(5))-methyltransferase RsmB [Clostridiales bacterium]